MEELLRLSRGDRWFDSGPEHPASVAQWQSRWLLTTWSGVQISPEARIPRSTRGRRYMSSSGKRKGTEVASYLSGHSFNV